VNTLKKLISGLVVIAATFGSALIASHFAFNQPKSPSMLVK
jgi:hypothetical protein